MRNSNEIVVFYVKTDSFVLFPEIWKFVSKFDEIYFDEKAPMGILWAGNNAEWKKLKDFKFNEKSKIFILGKKENRDRFKRFFRSKGINFKELEIRYRKPYGVLKKRVFCIVRPLPDALEFSYEMENYGAKAFPFPVLKFKPLSPPSLKKLLEEEFECIIFTSKRGIIALQKLLSEKEFHNFLKDKKIICIGPATSEMLKSMGYSVILPKEYSQEGIIKIFKNLKGCKKVLILRTEGRELLLKELKNMGVYAKEITIYKMVRENKEKIFLFSKLLKKSTDLIFTSPKMFEAFLKSVKDREIINDKKIICIGKITANYVEKKGFKVNLVPEKFTGEGIIEKILEEAEK